MRADLLVNTIEAFFNTHKRPICIEGSPGGGKTSLVHAAANKLGAKLVHLHMPTKLVEDFGIPLLTGDDNMRFALPDWFPRDEEHPTIILLDDRNQASNDLQKLLANMMQERELHGHTFGKNVMFISTGNRMSDRAGANRVLSHLRNRETIIDFDINLDDWCKWALDHGIHPVVVTFLRFRPNLLNDFDPQREANATPRSWAEGVSPIIGVVDPDAEFECIKGAVGEGPAAEFVGFLKIYRKLPNPDSIILHPDQGKVPTDLATLYALSGALAQRATDSNFDRVLTYADRMPDEFGVLLVSLASRRDPKLASTNAFTKWAVKHNDILF